MIKETKKTVLFVCTGNAGRSQIAQALFAMLAKDEVTVLSAGVEPWTHLHPVAVRLLQERRVDVAQLYPKHVLSLADKTIDWVITIGERARKETPRLSGNPKRLHWAIDDPADFDGTDQEEAAFRKALIAIEVRLPSLLEAVKSGADPFDSNL